MRDGGGFLGEVGSAPSFKKEGEGKAEKRKEQILDGNTKRRMTPTHRS